MHSLIIDDTKHGKLCRATYGLMLPDYTSQPLHTKACMSLPGWGCLSVQQLFTPWLIEQTQMFLTLFNHLLQLILTEKHPTQAIALLQKLLHKYNGENKHNWVISVVVEHNTVALHTNYTTLYYTPCIMCAATVHWVFYSRVVIITSQIAAIKKLAGEYGTKVPMNQLCSVPALHIVCIPIFLCCQ